MSRPTTRAGLALLDAFHFPAGDALVEGTLVSDRLAAVEAEAAAPHRAALEAALAVVAWAEGLDSDDEDDVRADLEGRLLDLRRLLVRVRPGIEATRLLVRVRPGIEATRSLAPDRPAGTDPCGIVHAALPPGQDIEVRDPDDEIVAHRALVHLERMDDDSVWLGITTPNGRRIAVDLLAEPPGRLSMFVRDEGEVDTPIPLRDEDGGA